MRLLVMIGVAISVLAVGYAVGRVDGRLLVHRRLVSDDGSEGPTGAAARDFLRLRFRRRAPERQALATFVESIAGLLRTGLSLPVALEMASRDSDAPLGESIRPLLNHANHVGLPAAIGDWAESIRTDHPQAPLVARALTMVSHGGVGAATALDGLAEGLRATISVEREVAALSSQARLSGAVMAVVPVGFALMLSGTDPAARTFLVGTPLGLVCLTVGLALDGVAWLVMRRLAVVRW